MQTQHASAHDLGADSGHGLFSHVGADHAETTPGAPVGQRSYTDLFREPVASPQTVTSGWV